MHPRNRADLFRPPAVPAFATFIALLLAHVFTHHTGAQQTAPATPRLFELHVVGPDGRPLPDVTVEIRGGLAGVARPIKRGTFVTPSLAKTDGKGALVFEVARDPRYVALCIKQPGFGPYWAQWDSQDHPRSIPEKFTAELDDGWSVGGVVVDQEGNPVEGATVQPGIRFKQRPGDFDDLHLGDDIKVDEGGRAPLGYELAAR